MATNVLQRKSSGTVLLGWLWLLPVLHGSRTIRHKEEWQIKTKELNKKVYSKNKKVLAGKRLVLINMAKQMWALHFLSPGWNKWYFRSHLDTDYQTSKFILTVWKYFPGILILSQCAIYWIFSSEARQSCLFSLEEAQRQPYCSPQIP